MQVSDVAALPIRWGAAARHARLFHPDGVLAEGTLERVAPAGEGLPMVSCEVVARVSKGIGLPDRLPDVAGLAWRMPPPQDLRSCSPWDVLLASTIANSRVLLAPTASWSGTTFSSLMPLRYNGALWWVRARLVTDIGNSGLSLDTIEAPNRLGRNRISISNRPQAPDGFQSAGPRCTAARRSELRRHRIRSRRLHSDCDVQLLPRWLADFRRAAYRRSREGPRPQ